MNSRDLKLRYFTQHWTPAPTAVRRSSSGQSTPIPTAHARRSLLPSATGRIAHVFLVATQRMPGFDQGMFERLLLLAGGFPRVSLAVLPAEADAFRARAARLGLAAEIEIVAAPEGGTLWPWAQDRMIVCRDEAGASIAVDSPLPGGNILADGDTCFVGADLCADDEAAFRAFAAVETRRAIHVIACDPLERRGLMRFQTAPGDWSWRQDIDRSISATGSRQPIFHIDMFMTVIGTAPNGRPRILLGDPAWASDLIGVALPEGFPIEAFTQIDRSLRNQGFDVVRNPLPFVYFDNPDAKLRAWFYASANNCWVECAEEGRRVWLPEYGFGAWPALKATDEANAAVWEGLGFEVIRGSDFLPLADQLGSLNCVSKILERGSRALVSAPPRT